MLSRVRNVLIISVLGVAGGMVKNILLARELSKEEVGLFFLLMTVVGFAYPITLLGQHNAFVRFMSDKSCSAYAWKGWFLKNLLFSLGLTLVAIIVVHPIYKFDTLSLTFLVVTTFSSALTDLFASIYRAQGRYEFSMLIFQMLSFILPIAALLLLVTKVFTFTSVLMVFSWLYLATPIAIIALSNKRLSSGEQTIPHHVWHDGLLLWGTDISFLIIVSIDKFLIPKLISYDALGDYFAIFSLMRGFDLLLRAIEFVLFPHIKRSGNMNIARHTLGALAAGAFLSLIYIVGGDFFLSVLFKGRYSNSAYLIPYFCILGSMRLLHTVPYSIIGGYLKRKRLQQMFYFNVLTVILAIILSFILIKLDGLRGALVASIVVWTFKTAAGFGIIWKEGTAEASYLVKEGLSAHV